MFHFYIFFMFCKVQEITVCIVLDISAVFKLQYTNCSIAKGGNRI